ncbi:MAG: DUF4230 domain-containing protein [Prevotella sp.]|nr:DUF4230 domain-containing protein [Prevotella sp.]
MRLFLSETLLLLLLSTLTACSSNDETPPTAAVLQDTIPSLVTQIQKCSRLYTTEYRIHKVVTHDDVLRLKGSLLKQDFDIPLPLGERKIAIPIDATLKAYIDFNAFSEKNIERHGSKITILLPEPKVVMTSSKVNQNEIREYVGLTRSHFSDKELSAYEQQGRQAILNSVPSLGIVEAAQANAARVLVPMLVEMGYHEEDIFIAFRKNLDIRQLINSNLERP